MAVTRPIAVITQPCGLDEARAMLPELAHEIADELRRRYGTRYDVEIQGSRDGQELADGILDESSRPAIDAETSQTLRVSQGWLVGALVALRWSSTKPDQVVLTCETQSKLEDRAMTLIVGGAGCVGVITGLFSLRLRLIGMLLGAILGLVLGFGAYKAFAAPILAVIQAGRRRTSVALAAALAARATRVIQASPFATPPLPADPLTAEAPAPTRADAEVSQPAAVGPAAPPAGRASPFRRPPIPPPAAPARTQRPGERGVDSMTSTR